MQDITYSSGVQKEISGFSQIRGLLVTVYLLIFNELDSINSQNAYK